MGLLRPASARYSAETLSRRCRLQLLRQLTCHSATEGLVYGLPQPQRQPPTGPPGRTPSPHCLHAFRPKPSSSSPV